MRAPARRRDHPVRRGLRGSEARAGLVAILVLAVLATALLAAEALAARSLDEQGTAEASRSLRAPTEVTVVDRPALLVLASGSADRVDLSAVEVPVGERGALLDELHVRFDDVRLHAFRVSGQDGLASAAPIAEEGEFRALLGPTSIGLLVDTPVSEVTIGSDSLRVDLPVGDGVDVDVSAEGGRVVLTPQTAVSELVRLDLEVDLSHLPGAPRVSSAEIVDGALELRGSLDDLTFAEEG